MITFRPFESDDIPGVLSLCRAARWNQVEKDWRRFLDLATASVKVAVDQQDRIIGSVSTIRYNNFSWIGMLIVHPEHRRRGLGTNLLLEALSMIGSNTTIRLDATSDGREVYQKLGFHDEYRLIRMQCDGTVRDLACNDRFDVSAMTRGTLEQIQVMDAEVFGADRSALLETLLSDKISFTLKSSGQIVAYSLGRFGHDFIHIGPVVAKELKSAILLITYVLKQHGAKPLIIDATYNDAAWISWLLEIGFTEQRPFIRMAKGSLVTTVSNNQQFAILGPEFG